MDLLDDPAPGSNTPEFSVGEIAGAVRRLIEGELGWVRVRGEVGRVVHARSGHLYFDLKDDRNVLSCMTWKGQIPGIGVMPEEGMEVVAEGRMTASGFQSKFSLNAQHVAVAGEGALMAMLEKRKKKLAAEGLFDEARKKPIPYLPGIIGVVTSPQGAVIRDILHRLRDRFPRKVLIWPVAVQGEACAPQVAAAIEGFNRLTPGGALPRPDLIIVARGGGSIEDLWGFNEEVVARAAAASDIPLISAVGHETDTTLIDYVSDFRAPTPTAAAERAVPVRGELLAGIETLGARLAHGASAGLARRRERVRDLTRGLPRPEALVSDARQRLDAMDERLRAALIRGVDRRKVRLGQAAGALRPGILRRTTGDHRRRLDDRGRALASAMMRCVEERRRMLDRSGAPDVARIAARVAEGRDGVTRAFARLGDAARRDLAQRRARLEAADRLREGVGYKATLARGYAVVRSGDAVVTGVTAARKAGRMEVEFADGRIDVVSGTEQAKPAKSVSRSGPASGGSDQGSLFD